MARLLVSLLAAPAAALHLPVDTGCTDAMDCSLGGKCVEGRCACSPMWQGERCEQLALGKASNVGQNGYRNPQGASWGGSAIRADDGTYHMFVSYMSNDCGLGSWKFNSVIHHTVSDDPEGPYTFRSVVFDEFAHNPTITRAPDGTYLLYHIGETFFSGEKPRYVRDCRLGRETRPEQAGFGGGPRNFDARIRVASSKSLDGPWELLNDGKPILEPRRGGDVWDTAVTNPAPLVLPNGSVLLYYRGDDRFGPYFTGKRHRKIGVAYADTWEGPYRRLRDDPITPSGEDPVVFANADGSGFHMIFENKFRGIVGQHAFSADGLQWTTVKEPMYDLQVDWEYGPPSRLDRRERPQFLRDEHGQPLYMFNAVQGYRHRGARYRNEQNTWTMAVPLGVRLPREFRAPQKEAVTE